MDDQRVGSSLRALRVRRRLRQIDASRLAGIPRRVVMLIEAGWLDRVRFGDIRRYAHALGARFDGSVRWQGADLDRMLNRGHAQMHEAMLTWLASLDGWIGVPEVSFAYGGERGVIDVLAWHASTETVLVIELKTRIADVNDLMSTMDVRRRLADRIARDRGWRPANFGIWVVLSPGRTNALALAYHASALRAKFPQDGRAMRGWLARPSGSVAALGFMPQVHMANLRHDATTPRRVRRVASSVSPVREPAHGAHEPRVGVTFRD